MNSTIETSPAEARVTDGYDDAIAYLTENPGQIREAWSTPFLHLVGFLFAYATPDRSMLFRDEICGCLTQVRAKTKDACSLELTEAIRGDERIPVDPDFMTVADLPAIAEWQRRIDRELNRRAPPRLIEGDP